MTLALARTTLGRIVQRIPASLLDILPYSIVLLAPLSEYAYVVFDSPVASDRVVNITIDDPLVASVPSAVTVNEEEIYGQFEITPLSAGNTIIRAEYNSIVVTAQLTVSIPHHEYGLDTNVEIDSDTDLGVLVEDGDLTVVVVIE